MARISEYPTAQSVQGDELIPCVQGGVNRNITPTQLIGGYEVKNVLQQITVGSSLGADYVSLNTAISNIGTVRTFRIVTAVTLSANINIPAGVTIIVGAQGSLSGAYTLTGNNTVLLFEGKNVGFAANVVFAGSWKTEDIDVVNFSVAADGTTDDSAVLNRVLDLTRLTNGKRVRIDGVYKLSTSLNVANVVLIGNPLFIGTNGNSAITATGTAGTFYPLSANALEGATVVSCSNGTFLSTISDGDLLLVSTNTVYGDGYNGGEVVEIVRIDGSDIYIKAALHLDYMTGDGAKIARISPVTFSNKGLIRITFPVDTVGTLATDRYTAGARFSYARDVDINITTLKTGGWGCSFLSCYRPRVYFRGTQGETAGYGYGVSIIGATMFANVTGTGIGFRHCVHHGGTTDGVPWESHIHDFYASGMLAAGATMFDTHPSTGSVVFVNCVAQGDNTYSGALAGFTCNGKNVSLINCEARNLGVGALVTDDTCQQISINGLRCTDVNYGFLMGSFAKADQFDLRNIRVANRSLRTGAVAYFGGGEVTNLFIQGLHGFNITSTLYLTTGGKYQSKMFLKDISCVNETDSGSYAVRLNDAAITELVIDGLTCVKCDTVLEVRSAVGSCIIRNFNVDGSKDTNPFNFYQDVGSVMFVNGAISDATTNNSCIARFQENVTSFTLLNTSINSANTKYVSYVTSGKTFTNFMHQGNVIQQALTNTHQGQTPTNTIVSGSIGIA